MVQGGRGQDAVGELQAAHVQHAEVQELRETER